MNYFSYEWTYKTNRLRLSPLDYSMKFKSHLYNGIFDDLPFFFSFFKSEINLV